jgi:hypothetical protein
MRRTQQYQPAKIVKFGPPNNVAAVAAVLATALLARYDGIRRADQQHHLLSGTKS